MRRTPQDQPAAANLPSGHQHDLRPAGDEPDAQGFTGQCQPGQGLRHRGGQERGNRRLFGGYTVSFVSILAGHDLGLMLAGLPGGRCSCPHWGYVLQRELTVRYGGREEVMGAGEAFYMPPGHVPAATAGSEFVQFSPTEAAGGRGGDSEGHRTDAGRLSPQPGRCCAGSRRTHLCLTLALRRRQLARHAATSCLPTPDRCASGWTASGPS